MIDRIVFAAGGTGGHIYPAVAVADELRKRKKDVNIYFIGAEGRIEEKIIPSCGYKLKTLKIKGFQRSGLGGLNPGNLIVLFRLLGAMKESRAFLKSYNPEVVFGTGGFVSGPVLWSATKLGIPSVVQEGNFYPGVTVKLLSSKVDKVILNFAGSRRFLKKQDNIEVMPYPVRENLRKLSRQEAVKFFGLSESKKTLFVFGGSQGASSINSAMLKSYCELLENNLQIIWQTGERDHSAIIDETAKYKELKIFAYIHDIDYAYSASDLVLCRAGISTVMELAYYGAAVIFVPFAFASENHQEKNARAMVEAGASEILLDSEVEEKLSRTVLGLINNEQKLQSMRNNIVKFADKQAASKIVDLLVSLSRTGFAKNRGGIH